MASSFFYIPKSANRAAGQSFGHAGDPEGFREFFNIFRSSKWHPVFDI
jgi:hypothetical protein